MLLIENVWKFFNVKNFKIIINVQNIKIFKKIINHICYKFSPYTNLLVYKLVKLVNRLSKETPSHLRHSPQTVKKLAKTKDHKQLCNQNTDVRSRLLQQKTILPTKLFCHV